MKERTERAARKYAEVVRDNNTTGLAAVYYRVRSNFGSWLFEYWTYYPFDVGLLGPHPHDTEHVFVEVDKIGGRVVGVLGAAHTNLNPNNLYSTSVKGSPSPQLPLSVIVELGKHAMAPDINGDGKFTPGSDVNVYSESSHIWGVRDFIGGTDSHMLQYESSMTLDRDLRRAWAVSEFHSYFPIRSLGVFNSLVNPVYELVAFPFPRESADKATATAPKLAPKNPCNTLLSKECADYKLIHHSDSRNPERIYKDWAFPFRQIRAGYANVGGTTNVSLGYVTDVKRIPFPGGNRLPLPGRIAFEGFAGPAYFNVDNLVTITRACCVRGLSIHYGGQYEKSLSNLFGYFVGYFRHKDFVTLHDADCPLDRIIADPSDLPTPVCVVRSNLYRAFAQFGPYIELPKVLRLKNLTFQIGPAFLIPQGTALYFRISSSLFRSRGRSEFGDPPSP